VENIQKAGFPDLSLKFVNDEKQKFYLALRSGKLEEAKEAADKLKEKVYFEKLAEKAMLIGKLDIAEFCYVKSHNLDKLIFFYTITGRVDKLRKVTNALQQTKDNSRRFMNSIYTCNVDEKVSVLNETGHNSLALLVAKLHNRSDLIDVITDKGKRKVNINETDYNNIKQNMKPIIPLKPIVNIKNKECKL
jgi:coatomer protein complex subunit alpha (xenin)